jgi:F420H(2)-dependent quinone reductase
MSSSSSAPTTAQFIQEVGTERFEARARVAEGEERDRLYVAQAAIMPGFADYQRKTSRQIPVVVLERR